MAASPRVGGLDRRGDRLALDGLRDVVVEPEVPATELGELAVQDRAVRRPDLDMDDARGVIGVARAIDHGGDLALDRRDPVRRHAGRLRSASSRPVVATNARTSDSSELTDVAMAERVRLSETIVTRANAVRPTRLRLAAKTSRRRVDLRRIRSGPMTLQDGTLSGG